VVERDCCLVLSSMSILVLILKFKVASSVRIQFRFSVISCPSER
jgi:hypothetical protein